MPGIVPEAGCVQISQVSVLKFNSFLVSQCCVFFLKWSLPRSPPHELKCFRDPSLIMFYLWPQEKQGPSGPMPGRVKAPKHKIVAREPIRRVMKRRWLHYKRPVFPVGQRMWECYLYPQCGSEWQRMPISTPFKATCPQVPPGRTMDPYMDSLPRASCEAVTCRTSRAALYFRIWTYAFVLLWQLVPKLPENRAGP